MNEIDRNLLARYLSGECSKEEKQTVSIWIESDPANRQSLEFMRHIWETPEVQRGESDVEELRREIHRRAGIESKPILPIRSIRATRAGGSRYQPVATRILKIAAVFLAIVSIPYFYQKFSQAPPLVKVLVERGKSNRLTLPDGSLVQLDSGSLLLYPGRFAGRTRKVYLDGEGYFEIKPDKKKPFLVHADGAEIRVLGTQFNVRHWPVERRVQVDVAEGRVSFSQVDDTVKNSSVILRAGQMSVMEEGQWPSEPQGADVDRYFAWQNRELHFESMPLRQVLDQLERWYDFRIHLQDRKFESNLITVYIENEPIEDILEMLALIMNMDYEVTGRDIVFSPK